MPSDTNYEKIKQALTAWQAKAEKAIKAGQSPLVDYQSEMIPPHVQEHLQKKLPKAESAYGVGVYFDEAIQMAKYPPGFVSPHPAYLAYKGPGISAEDHVQNHLFRFQCPLCRSKRVMVLSSEWGVNITNGDARGTFKAKCQRCRKTFSGGFED